MNITRKCRAVDPSKCRIHGSKTFDSKKLTDMPLITSTADLKRNADKAGSYFLDDHTLKVFGNRMAADIYDGRFFVMSEKYEDSPRYYRVIQFNFYSHCDDEGYEQIGVKFTDVGRSGLEIAKFRTAAEAKHAAKICSVLLDLAPDLYADQAEKYRKEMKH